MLPLLSCSCLAPRRARMLLCTCLVGPLVRTPASSGCLCVSEQQIALAAVVWGCLWQLCWRCCICAQLRSSAQLYLSILTEFDHDGAGVHKEALQWPLLLELCCLLPSLHLHVVMVSPSLPDGLSRHASWVGLHGACSLIGVLLSEPTILHPGVPLFLHI